MNKISIFTVLLVVLLCNNFINAQKEFQVANKQFDLGIYDESLKTLQSLEKSQNLDANAVALKAMSQYYLGDYFAAVNSFNKARTLSPTDYSFSLAYANALIRTGQFDVAKSELSFLTVDATVSHLMDYCDHGLSKMGLKSTNKLMLDGRSASFGAFNHSNGLYYNTYAMPLMDDLAKKTISGQLGFHLVKPEGKNEMNVLKGLGNKLNIGNVSLTNDGTMAYTRNIPLCESLHCRIKNSSIFIAKLDNGTLIDEISLPFNELGVSNIDPYLSNDGKTLYFASNRKGGFGGFDLYVSKMENGKWSMPENLGPQMNTVGDEISPSQYNEIIYFSSNWHLGLGGFDIFSFNDGKVNCVDGVNSFADDYLAKLSGKKLFYSSNRTGRDGIYVNETKVDENFVAQRVEIPSEMSKSVAPVSNSYVGARLVSKGYTITKTNVETYFVQLAAFGKDSKNFDKFKNASKYGDIFKFHVGNAVKIRIGSFDNKSNATNVLNQIKKDGFPDAFIVAEVMNTENLELLYTSPTNSTSKNSNTSMSKSDNFKSTPAVTGNSGYEVVYKVRLASYEDPIWFDNSKVKDLGSIEQWSKGTWTIFVLGGFKSFEAAESARIKAANRGFSNAEVVMDTGGILESMKKN